MKQDYAGKISEQELCHVLSRAVSYSDGMASRTFEDDLRMLAELQPRFLGRSAFPWERTPWTLPSDAGLDGVELEAVQFARGKNFTRRIHEVLPETFCQAVVWEGVYPSVSEIPIPDWAFIGLDRPPEDRCFRYDDMFEDDYEALYRWDDHGEGCQVYDLTLPESQLWVYYRACHYINAGFEALHMGQPHKYAAKDHRYAILDDLYRRIRLFARERARRGIVLLDAHTHGIARDGRLLYDLHARPISARAWREQPERILLHLKGSNLGGVTPSGWRCDSLPFLVEIDNWGGYSLEPDEWDDLDKRARHGRWGWDDIAWFAHQDDHDRRHFLTYGHRWTRAQSPVAFFQMPTRRRLDRAKIEVEDPSSDVRYITHYHANVTSPAVPFGFSDEETIHAIWSEPEPDWLPEWHSVLETAEAEVGQDIPPPLVLVGTLQQALGGIVGESFCPFSRLSHVQDDHFEKVFVIPWAGTYDFSLSIGGTMTDVTRQGGFAGGAPYLLRTTQDNQWVRLQYFHWQRQLTAVDEEGRSLLLVEDLDPE